MFSTEDTIVAIATPPGRGGIGVVRIAGPDAHAIARRLIGRERQLEPRRATFATVRLKADQYVVSGDPPTLEGPASHGETRRSAEREGGSRTHDTNGRTNTIAIDHVVVLYFPAPASYTGEDVVELSAHGSPVVLRSIVSAAIDAGARLAEPGEFTLRAFVNGRIDLTQAEAVADLIDSVTPLQARAAFDQLQGTLTRAIAEIDAALFDLVARLEASVDFPEEGYHFVDPAAVADAIDAIIARTRTLMVDARRGRLVREGLQIAIVGPPNVGKSSLFNALVGSARAIVTDVAGTTRDLVTETVDLDGLKVTLVDTAGLRDTDDVIESEGVRRSSGAAAVSDLILLVSDGSQPSGQHDIEMWSQVYVNKTLTVSNKADLGCVDSRQNTVPVSAVTGVGLDLLRARIRESLDVDFAADRPAITNVRHLALLERAHGALMRARDATSPEGGSLPEEFVLADLQEARAALEEISGKRAPEALLSHIFSRFCIGK